MLANITHLAVQNFGTLRQSLSIFDKLLHSSAISFKPAISCRCLSKNASDRQSLSWFTAPKQIAHNRERVVGQQAVAEGLGRKKARWGEGRVTYAALAPEIIKALAEGLPMTKIYAPFEARLGIG